MRWFPEGTALTPKIVSSRYLGMKWDCLSRAQDIIGVPSIVGAFTDPSNPFNCRFTEWQIAESNNVIGTLSSDNDIQTPPVVLLENILQESACTKIIAKIIDNEANPVGLHFEYRLLGEKEWIPISTININGEVGTVNLATSASGISYTLLWDALRELGDCGSCAVEIRACAMDILSVGAWSDPLSLTINTSQLNGYPQLSITPTVTTVEYTQHDIQIQGTANTFIEGDLSLLNLRNDLADSIPVSENWIGPSIELQQGDNTILVQGMGSNGLIVSDQITIFRKRYDSVYPALSVTNIIKGSVSNSLILLGTANSYVKGTISFSQKTTENSLSAPASEGWISPDIPIIVGTNIIEITATNLFNHSLTIESLWDASADHDGDGIPNGQELLNEMNPLLSNENTDIDGDGIMDVDEVLNGLDPCTSNEEVDSDGDGLLDIDEVNNHKTNPLEQDSDGDGMMDDAELQFDTDPLDENSLLQAWLLQTDVQGNGTINPPDRMWFLDAKTTNLMATAASRHHFNSWSGDTNAIINSQVSDNHITVELNTNVFLIANFAPNPSLQFLSATYNVEENDGHVRVFVSRTGDASGSASVNYVTANGSAAEGSDYTATSSVLNWSDDESGEKFFDVPILNDNTPENDENFTVILSGVLGASMGVPDTTTVTIINDDNSPPLITEGDNTSVFMDENGTPTPFSLTLHATDADVEDVLTWSIDSRSSYGIALVSETGTQKAISYTPKSNFNGNDSFVVQVDDGNGGIDIITVNVIINDKISDTIALLSNKSGGYNLWKGTYSGTNIIANSQITFLEPPYHVGNFKVDPIHQRIVYSYYQEGYRISNFKIIDFNGNFLGDITNMPSDGGGSSAFDISPDGTEMVFSKGMEDQGLQLQEGYVVGLDNSNLRKILSANAVRGVNTHKSSYDWVTNDKIIFANTRVWSDWAGQHDIHIYDSGNISAWSQNTSSGDANPLLSSEGKTLALSYNLARGKGGGISLAVWPDGPQQVLIARTGDGSGMIPRCWLNKDQLIYSLREDLFVINTNGIGNINLTSTPEYNERVVAILSYGLMLKITSLDRTNDLADTAYTIEWIDEDTDSDAKISLYYNTTNNQSQNGTLIAENISEDDETDSYIWDTTQIPEGEYTIYAVIDDGVNEPVTNHSSGLVIIEHNDPPILSAIGNQSVDEQNALTFALSATDPDVDDVLIYSATNLPTGASFDPSTRTFNWTPTYDQSGIYSNVHFKVSDGELRDSEEIIITVGNIDQIPVITEGDSIVVMMDEDGSPTPFDLTLNATDNDGDAITWSIDSQSSHGIALVSGTSTQKTIFYAPESNFNGSDSFVVQVDDGNDGIDTITVNVTINPRNDPSQIQIIEPDGTNDLADSSYTIQWIDYDPDDDATISLYYNTTNNQSQNGTLIAENISEDDEIDSFDWNTTQIPEGEYIIYAVIDDGVNEPITHYNQRIITIHHSSPFVLLPPDENFDDRFGELKAFGNFNNDNYEDLVILAPGFDNSSGKKVGKGYVYYGTPNGFDPDSYLEIEGIYESDSTRLGIRSVAISDFDNDGYDDLILGNTDYLRNSNTAKGCAMAFLSKSDGSGLDLNNYIEFMGYIARGNFAGTMVSGDVNGDDIDDLIVSAVHENGYAGKVYVYYGGTNFDNIYDKVLSKSGTTILGGRIASGDVNGDGYDDIIARDTPSWNGQSTRIFIFLGGEDMSQTPIYTRTIPYCEIEFFNDRNLKDINNDGYDDIVLSSGDQWEPSTFSIIKGAENFNINDEIQNTLDGEIYRIYPIKDINSDGINDISVSLKKDGKLSNYVFSGDQTTYVDTSNVLRHFTDNNISDGFGVMNVMPADMNGDGILEFYGYSKVPEYNDVIFIYRNLNDFPVLSAIGNQSVDEQTALTFTLSATDPDVDDVLIYSATNLPTGASFDPSTRTFNWTPTFQQAGIYSNVHFEVSDGELRDSEKIIITVGNIDQIPVITEGDSIAVTMDEDGTPTSFDLTLNATDNDGDAITWSIDSQSSHGIALVSGTGTQKAIFYAPESNFNGSDSFVVQVDDGNGGSDTITVNVTINPRNDVPNNTMAPSVNGIYRAGETLTADKGTWNDHTDQTPGTLNYTYQWQCADDMTGSNASDISDANSSMYILQLSDQNKYIRVVVTATDNGEGLPTTQSISVSTDWNLASAYQLRNIFVEDAIGTPGREVKLNIMLSGQGDENGLGFAINYDTNVLTYSTVSTGADASGGLLLFNDSQTTNGRLGIVLSLQPNQRFPMGTNHLVQVSFLVNSETSLETTSVLFTDVPTQREIVDTTANPLSVSWTDCSLIIIHGYEGDVAPRPNGNENLSVADWIQAGRFAVSLDIPEKGNEFQRADCAPRNTYGDERISVADWTQAGRYAVGLDPQTPAASPAESISSTQSSMQMTAMKTVLASSSTRTLKALDTTIQHGQTNWVAVCLEATGDERAIGFSLNYDTNVVKFIDIRLGDGANGATIVSNTATEGYIGAGISYFNQTFNLGTQTVAEISFEGISIDSTLLHFCNQPVICEIVDSQANALNVSYLDATMIVESLEDLDGDHLPDAWEQQYGRDFDLNGDPDNDDISNFLEYAYNLDPTNSSRVGLPSHSLTEESGTNYFQFEYRKRKAGSGLIYDVLISKDLIPTSSWLNISGWNSNNPSSLIEKKTLDLIDGETKEVTVRMNTANQSQGFIKLKIQKNK